MYYENKETLDQDIEDWKVSCENCWAKWSYDLNANDWSDFEEMAWIWCHKCQNEFYVWKVKSNP